jgi:rare lipoprotein A
MASSRVKAAILALLLAVGAAACSRLPAARTEGPLTRGGVETGVASWYGGEFHGRLTSNREIYDMNDMTAAHPYLPFGTLVMVTNLENERTAIVRINDRGPFAKGRIIDLSYAAARVLGMVGPGTARVRLEVLAGYPGGAPVASFFVQVGSFAEQENAYILKRRLDERYEGVMVSVFRTEAAVYYRVRVRAADREAAMVLARRLADEGFPVLLLEE